MFLQPTVLNPLSTNGSFDVSLDRREVVNIRDSKAQWVGILRPQRRLPQAQTPKLKTIDLIAIYFSKTKSSSSEENLDERAMEE